MRQAGGPRPQTYVLYLAVLPAYRQACVAELDRRFGRRIGYYVGAEHLDNTVKTAITSANTHQVRNVGLLGRRVLLQIGAVGRAVSASAVVVDLTPRSLTAWVILLVRGVLRRRTVVWGHLHPRAGGRPVPRCCAV